MQPGIAERNWRRQAEKQKKTKEFPSQDSSFNGSEDTAGIDKFASRWAPDLQTIRRQGIK